MKGLKKVLALALVAIFAVGVLAACGKSGGGDTPEPAGSGSSAAPAGATMKVGLICLHDENSTYDLNFINGFKEACEAEGVEYLIRTNIGETQDCYDTAVDLADKGCTLICADSFGHEDFMIQAAKEFPNVQFCHATGTKAHTENLDNYANAFASIYQGRFLAGVAAGMKLNEMIADGKITADQAKMGYVGAYTYAEVISGYTSFYLGAKSVCPTVTMDVTFTGSWYDPAAEQEGAETLIKRGCALISQHADSLGAPTACENAGVPNVSYNGSTQAAGPNTFIVSSRINWAPYYRYAIQCVKEGKPVDKDWTGTLDTESVQLTELNDAVAAAGTAEAIADVKAKLQSGELQVFDTATFTVDGAPVTTYMADVDSDEAYQGDTEVIIDGAFMESKFRSAPYFDLQIDGITLLDTAF
ncbi:MAG: BMP family ABC transporter substrate-binding protein [Lachnospiraceae bacterium]|nr:BMP family ABC transporter substrate-binding protein [Lachnospiraceae bacterium]